MTVSEIRIAAVIPKDATAITPFALVEGLSVFRFHFLTHESPHWCMVEIAERKEAHSQIAHDFSE